MILTVEPMINAGKRDIFVDAANEWTVYTHDRSLSAQWEHTILITENGPEILTY
jgi:methionyl aminopeptidase